MLKDEALDFYNNFMNGESQESLTEICKAFKEKFEGPEYHKKNYDKSISECLQILTRQLAQMQHGLDKNLRNDDFIHNKIVTACENQIAFNNVCERPAVTLNGLISDLRSAAEFHDRTNKKASANQTLFTDQVEGKPPDNNQEEQVEGGDTLFIDDFSHSDSEYNHISHVFVTETFGEIDGVEMETLTVTAIQATQENMAPTYLKE
ncbi:hypothetical protein GcM3_208039 [Golovinomyces cichoracearum]|uniref:Integrase and RNaseH domain-containing protein n=1 Tax=Golovinomyces cichoracearum TaxID=62708 RepID=A0A420HAS1_9PEZI|nr:hypothetical protein GcM3_208039 [Golovinomyces cichoracearum]